MTIDTSASPALPKRPNFEKESIAFETIKGIGLGAVIGAGINLAITGIANLAGKKMPLSGLSILSVMTNVGIMSGVISYLGASDHNRNAVKAKTYVEKLERELLAKNATADISAPQR